MAKQPLEPVPEDTGDGPEFLVPEKIETEVEQAGQPLTPSQAPPTEPGGEDEGPFF